MATKRCSACSTEKPLEDFYAGYYSCKKCHIARTRNWSQANKDKRNAIHRRYKYGEAALALDYSRCEVCGSTDRVGTDHDHATGLVRGALCNDCNLAVGRAHDDSNRLRLLADYLDRQPIMAVV